MRLELIVVGLLLAGCGGTPAGGDAGVLPSSLEACGATSTRPAREALVSLELQPSGVVPGSGVRPVAGTNGYALIPGAPLVSFASLYTAQTNPGAAIASEQAPLQPGVPNTFSLRLAPPDFSVYAFSLTEKKVALEQYVAAATIDPEADLAVRVGFDTQDFIVNGQAPATRVQPVAPTEPNDQVVDSVTRYSAIDVSVIFRFGGDAACHLRNLQRLTFPLEPGRALELADLSVLEGTPRAQVKTYLSTRASPTTHVVALRTNAEAWPDLPSCDLLDLDGCAGLSTRLSRWAQGWLDARQVPDQFSLVGPPERGWVEGLVVRDVLPSP